MKQFIGVSSATEHHLFTSIYFKAYNWVNLDILSPYYNPLDEIIFRDDFSLMHSTIVICIMSLWYYDNEVVKEWKISSKNFNSSTLNHGRYGSRFLAHPSYKVVKFEIYL